MRTTMSFLTSTSAIAGELPTAAPRHQLVVEGYDRAGGRIVLREHVGAESALALLSATGPNRGTTITLARGTAPGRRPLSPLVEVDRAGWELTTRVIQRRGLRLFGEQVPIRKFALGLTVEHRPGGVLAAHGRVVATAYLRPRASITAVWAVPDEPIAVAIVTYCGVPTGLGVDKQIAVLAAPVCH